MPRRSALRGFSAAVVVAVFSTALISTTPAPGGSCYRWSRLDRKIARKTNGARARRGVRRLHIDRQLSLIARRHTKSMIRARTLRHTSMTRLR